MATPIFSGGAGVTYTVSTSGAGGGGGYGPPGSGQYDIKEYKLTQERLEEWQWFTNFMDQNPDVKERFAVHKTYEILNNENTEK